jgi:hypothetical protein
LGNGGGWVVVLLLLQYKRKIKREVDEFIKMQMSGSNWVIR